MTNYNKNSSYVVKGAGMQLLQENNPFFETYQKKKNENSTGHQTQGAESQAQTTSKTTTRTTSSMPVGGDIETEEDMELFLAGMRSEEQEKADRSARARLKYSARPEVRQRIIDYNEAQLKEKSRQGIFERVFAEEYKKDPEKAYLKAWEVAENDKYAKAEEERLNKRIRELKFATDIENAGRIPAQIASESAFATAKANGHMNPAGVSMQSGDAVMAEYNALARRARNDLYYHNLNNQIAGHEEIKQNPDYAKFVARGETDTPNMGFYEKNRLGKELVNYINDPNYPLYYTVENNGRGWDAERFAKLSEEEKDVIRAYASVGDYATVEEYYKLLERDLNERVQNEKNEKYRDFSYEHPLWAGVGNVASGFLTAPAYLANAGQVIKNGITGEYVPTDRNSSAFRMTHFGEQSEEGIGDRVYDAVGGGKAGEIAETITRGGLSGVRDLSKATLGVWGIPFAALDGASSTTHDILQNGGDMSEAFLKSSGTGLATAYVGGYEGNIMPFVDTIASEIILGEDSEYQTKFRELQENGMTKEAAARKAGESVFGKKLWAEMIERTMEKFMR